RARRNWGKPQGAARRPSAPAAGRHQADANSGGTVIFAPVRVIVDDRPVVDQDRFVAGKLVPAIPAWLPARIGLDALELCQRGYGYLAAHVLFPGVETRAEVPGLRNPEAFVRRETNVRRQRSPETPASPPVRHPRTILQRAPANDEIRD